MDELTGYRVKIERDGKELLNVPGILALPAALIAPKASIIGTIAASLLGCRIRLENESGNSADVGETVRKAADRYYGSVQRDRRHDDAGIKKDGIRPVFLLAHYSAAASSSV